MAVLDIRGTHGSGKSWIVHQLLKKFGKVPLTVGLSNIPIGYQLGDSDVAVVGQYRTRCGGCDGVGDASEIVARVKAFSSLYRHVVMEGALVSHTFARYSQLARELEEYGYLFAFLDTPVELCVERVQQRRYKRGKWRKFDPKNVVKDHNNVWQIVRNKCIKANHRLIVLDHKNPLPAVLEFLELD